MIRNPQIDAFFDKLAAANVQHRCNWQAKRSPDLKGYDIEHLSFVGDGFSPSEATAVLISYGNNGYGLYFDGEGSTIDGDVSRIAKPRAKQTADAAELAETLRLMHQHYGTLHDLVSDLIEDGKLNHKAIANKLEECGTVADRAQRVLAARLLADAADGAALALLKSALADWPQFDVETVMRSPGCIPEDQEEAQEVNGGDMVEWFGGFREKAKAVIAAGTTTDFGKVGATLANVAKYDAALNEAEIAPNGDDYNAILSLLNGADYSAPHKEGR